MYKVSFLPVNKALCYHSISDEESEGKVAHRISNDNFHSQLVKLKKQGYSFLPIDEYVTCVKKKKVTSVTFDDGYKDLTGDALKVLLDLKIPFTLFLNGCLLNGERLWRDDIRIIIKMNLIDKFDNYLVAKDEALHRLIDWDNFYGSTKTNLVNSKRLHIYLKDFLKIMDIESQYSNEYIRSIDLESMPKELFTLGNHSFDHYRLATLTYDEQYEDILLNKHLIDQIDIPKSRVFSIPFGGNDSFNQDTIDVLLDLGYLGFLTTDLEPLDPIALNLNTRGLKFASRTLLKNEAY